MSQALQKTEEKAIEFIPFAAADKIKLSVRIVQNIIAVPTKSGKTPTDRDAIRFMMLCQAQRLNPFAGDAFCIGYDSQKYGPVFSLITAHQTFLKRAETSPDYEGLESGIILQAEDGTISEREGDFALPDEVVVGGWAKVYRKGRRPMYKRLSTDQRKPKYETDFWEGAKAREQIVKCAEADALRASFPTLLGGLYTHGESDVLSGRIVAEMTTTRPIFEPPAQLKDAAVLPAQPTEPAASAQTEQKGGAENAPAEAAGGLQVLDGNGQQVGSVPTDGEPELGPDQAWLASGMQAANVAFDDFISWLKTTGYAQGHGWKGDVDSLPDWGAVPGQVIAALKKDSRAVAALIKIHGKKA